MVEWSMVGGKQREGVPLEITADDGALETAEEFRLGWIRSLFQPASGEFSGPIQTRFHF